MIVVSEREKMQLSRMRRVHAQEKHKNASSKINQQSEEAATNKLKV